MANTLKAIGMRPLYPIIRANVYKHVTGAPIYMYQPATLNASGYAEIAVIDGTTAGEAILGSVIGFLGGDWAPESSSYSGYLPANPTNTDSNGYVNVLIADDPNQFFVMQEDSGGTALTQAAVGAGTTFCHFTAASGSTISGVSTVNCAPENGVGIAPSSNLNLQLIKLWDKPDNAYGDWAKWVVRISDHQFNRNSLSAGSELV